MKQLSSFSCWFVWYIGIKNLLSISQALLSPPPTPHQIIKALTVFLSFKWNIPTFWHWFCFRYLAHHKFKAWDPFSFSCNNCFPFFWSCELYGYISQEWSWQTAICLDKEPVYSCTVLGVHHAHKVLTELLRQPPKNCRLPSLFLCEGGKDWCQTYFPPFCLW